MKLDYYIDHYEIEYVEFTWYDGTPKLIETQWAYSEEEAIAFAKKKLGEGKSAKIQIVQNIVGWENML